MHVLTRHSELKVWQYNYYRYRIGVALFFFMSLFRILSLLSMRAFATSALNITIVECIFRLSKLNCCLPMTNRNGLCGEFSLSFSISTQLVKKMHECMAGKENFTLVFVQPLMMDTTQAWVGFSFLFGK